MARYTGPKNKLSRREGFDLFGKGLKLRRASVPPGQHGPKGSKRPTGFGLQLREKQKLRRMYGIMEKQFRRYFEKASKRRGNTGATLLSLLEMRLDNVVYRLGFTPTRTMARQIVGHGHVRVNGKKVGIPSYQVKVSDQISLSEKITKNPVVAQLLQNQDVVIPTWLSKAALVGTIVSLPKRTDVDASISEQLVVEYYSK